MPWVNLQLDRDGCPIAGQFASIKQAIVPYEFMHEGCLYGDGRGAICHGDTKQNWYYKRKFYRGA